MNAPLTIEFATGTRLYRESDRVSHFPIIGNGPPGTFVVFPNGLRVSLPTDQLVSAMVRDNCVVVGFGGMAFTGLEGDVLVFVRVREMHPEAALSPDRSHVMRLQPAWITAILVEGRRVWPA